MSTILVVDDEPDLRSLLRWIFESAGHDVVEAGDGMAALACVRRSLPDLVVTDMMMPVMGGAELIRRLRADSATAGILVLAISGDTPLAASADLVLGKPFRREQVLTAAATLLTRGTRQP